MSDPATRVLCPYCGHTQALRDRCGDCGGLFEPLSQRATQVAMGPWFIRDKRNPFRPGCSYAVLKKQIEAGKVKPRSVIRGPTTKQFWARARRVPGVAHLLGTCHACGIEVKPTDTRCAGCGAAFREPSERNELGLMFATAAEAAAAQRELEALRAREGGAAAPPAHPMRPEERGEHEALFGSDLLAEVIGPSAPGANGQAAEPARADGRSLPRPQPRRVHAAPPPEDAPAAAASAGEPPLFAGEPIDLSPGQESRDVPRYDGGGLSTVTWLLVAMIVVAFVLLVILLVPLLQEEPAAAPLPTRPPPAAAEAAPPDASPSVAADER